MRAKIIQPTPENFSRLARALQQGELVGMPTETVYGLAGDCRSPLAISRIFSTKERPTFDPLIVHVSLLHRSLLELSRMELIDLKAIPENTQGTAEKLIQAFWPGPLTLILPKHPSVPDLVTSGLNTVALRMPNHPMAQALIAASGLSLAAPSANRFGRISPTTAQAVAEELGDRIDWILDGGNCRIGVESTVISFEDTGEIRVLRPGGISVEQLRNRAEVPVLERNPSHSYPVSDPEMTSPGLLASHYAPRKPMFLLPSPIAQISAEELKFSLLEIRKRIPQFDPSQGLGILLISGDPTEEASKISSLVSELLRITSLSRNGSYEEAAQRLFSTLREMDRCFEIQAIIAEPCLSSSGLGFAIQDRLTRASAPRSSSAHPSKL